jgi:hypothetical protein
MYSEKTDTGKQPTLRIVPKHDPPMTPPSKAMRQSWKSALERLQAARRAA